MMERLDGRLGAVRQEVAQAAKAYEGLVRGYRPLGYAPSAESGH